MPYLVGVYGAIISSGQVFAGFVEPRAAYWHVWQPQA